MLRSRRSLIALLVVLVSTGGSPAAAELASMVADLELRTGSNPNSQPGPFVRLGPRVAFFASDSDFSPRPWTTDGTAGGTRPLGGGELRQEVGTLGSTLLWFGDGALWRTQGTPATTFALAEGAANYDEDDYEWARVGTTVFFFRFGASASWQLWASDGSAAGTRAVTSLPPGERAAAAAAHGGVLYFVTGVRAGSLPGHAPLTDFKLWRSDGTAAGTRVLRALPGGRPLLRSAASGLLIFTGQELWVSDGTRGGTRPLFEPPGGPRFDLEGARILEAALGGRVFFYAHGTEGWTLWVSDGRRAGTHRLATGPFPTTTTAAVLGNQLYFVAADDGVPALWRSGGTPATTGSVVDLCVPEAPCPLPFAASGPGPVAAGGRLFFLAADAAHGAELWTSDGTAAGTRLVRDVCPGPCDSQAVFQAAGGEVFFYATEPSHGVELWASDGTEAGTRRLSDGLPEPPAGNFHLPPQLALLGGRVVTAGWDPRGGIEPWSFDLGGGGGRRLADIATGGEPGSEPAALAALGDRVLFLACVGGRFGYWSSAAAGGATVELLAAPEPGCGFSDLPLPAAAPPISIAGDRGYLRLGDLWVTDGTPAGTLRLTDFGTAFERNRASTAVVEAGAGAVFAVAFGTPSSLTSSELWVTDGTPGGTRPLGLPAFPSFVLQLAVVGGEAYFWADDGIGGGGVWRLDSTLTSLTRLSEHGEVRFPHPLDPGFVEAGGQVYFLLEVEVLEDGTSHREVRLWRTDGTPAGTQELPPPVGGGNAQEPTSIAALADSLLVFTTTPSPESRARLWRREGAGGEPVLIHDFGPRTFLLEDEIVPRGGELLFLLDDESGAAVRRRLYRSDGTAAGTAAAIDLTAVGATAARNLAAAAGRLYFAAGGGVLGGELWTSEGGPSTTRRLQEIAPGAAGSAPGEFTVAGTALFFTADDGLHGRELWSLPLDGLDAPCRPAATALCLGDGRFRAELFSQDRRGERRAGRASVFSSDAGAFWFYAPGNPETVVKVVDGRVVNGAFWLFHGPLTDAEVALTVTDLVSGDSRRYPAAPGLLGAFADTVAFPAGGTGSAVDALPPPAAAGEPGSGPCLPSAARICLHGGRFAVGLDWRDAAGVERPAHAFAHGDRAGYFSFHGLRDVQAAFKLLDGRPVNGAFWLFASALTHVEYTLTVTDLETGSTHRFVKPAGEISSRIDLSSVR